MLKWLNPLNWFRTSVAEAVDRKVDEVVTVSKGKELLVAGVNKVVSLSEGKWDDAECAKYSRALKLAGKALTDLGDAIDPESEEGRSLSADEFEVLLADGMSAFGSFADEDLAARVRGEIKNYIHEKIGA